MVPGLRAGSRLASGHCLERQLGGAHLPNHRLPARDALVEIDRTHCRSLQCVQCRPKVVRRLLRDLAQTAPARFCIGFDLHRRCDERREIVLHGRQDALDAGKRGGGPITLSCETEEHRTECVIRRLSDECLSPAQRVRVIHVHRRPLFYRARVHNQPGRHAVSHKS